MIGLAILLLVVAIGLLVLALWRMARVDAHIAERAERQAAEASWQIHQQTLRTFGEMLAEVRGQATGGQ